MIKSDINFTAENDVKYLHRISETVKQITKGKTGA